MKRNTTRVAAAVLTLAGAVGLSACNSGTSVSSQSSTTTQESSPTTSSAPTESQTQESSSQSSSSSETSTESSSPESSSTESSSPESSSTESSTTDNGGSGSGNTASDAKLKMGEAATIKDGKNTFDLTVTSLEEAPDSIYSKSNLQRSNGTVYFLKYKVKAVNVGGSYLGTNSVNGLFLKPYFDNTRSGKRLYGSVDECKTDPTKLSAGQSGEGCYIYQIPGDKISKVTYNDITTYSVIWE